MWNTSGAAFQINLLRNADVMAYSTASPPSGSVEFWNGDRGANQMPAGNWTDPQYYSLKIDMAGNMNVYTNSGTTVQEAATQWTITGWGQTVLRGSVDITSVPGTTRLVVKDHEYRNFPAGINANPQESFTGQMYTEVAAYSFTGVPGDLTTGTALTVEIDTSYTGPAGPQLFSAGSVGPSFTEQVFGAGDYVASIVSSQPNDPSGFNADGADSAAQAVLIQTAATLTSSLVAAVTMSTGAQTFAATYTDATTAGTQVLTMTDDGAALVVAGTVTGASNKTSTSVAVSYADCADGKIVATLTVQDANTDTIYYTYTTGTAFTTEQFKAPAAPTATFDINAIGNDNTFKTTLTAINANNGFGDATNMTWQVSTSAAASGLLSDCSGVYHPIVNGRQEDIVGPTGANAFVVNDSYYIQVTKTNTYANAAGNYPTSTGVPASIATAGAYIGPVKYKGNPVIGTVTIDDVTNKISVSIALNQTTLSATGALAAVFVSNIINDGVSPQASSIVVNSDNAAWTIVDKVSATLNDYPIGHDAKDNTFYIMHVSVQDGDSARKMGNVPGALDTNFNHINH